MKKFTHDEIKKKIGKDEREIREKVLLLSNGMIVIHGFKREEAFQKALVIAREWLENGGRYEHKTILDN